MNPQRVFSDAGGNGPSVGDQQICSGVKDNIYMKGIPKRWANEDLLAFMSAFGTVLSCRVMMVPAHKPGGCKVGMVQMGSAEQAQAAISTLDGTVAPGGSKPMQVRLARNAPRKGPEIIGLPRVMHDPYGQLLNPLTGLPYGQGHLSQLGGPGIDAAALLQAQQHLLHAPMLHTVPDPGLPSTLGPATYAVPTQQVAWPGVPYLGHEATQPARMDPDAQVRAAVMQQMLAQAPATGALQTADWLSTHQQQQQQQQQVLQQLMILQQKQQDAAQAAQQRQIQVLQEQLRQIRNEHATVTAALTSVTTAAMQAPLAQGVFPAPPSSAPAQGPPSMPLHSAPPLSGAMPAGVQGLNGHLAPPAALPAAGVAASSYRPQMVAQGVVGSGTSSPRGDASSTQSGSKGQMSPRSDHAPLSSFAAALSAALPTKDDAHLYSGAGSTIPSSSVRPSYAGQSMSGARLAQKSADGEIERRRTTADGYLGANLYVAMSNPEDAPHH